MERLLNFLFRPKPKQESSESPLRSLDEKILASNPKEKSSDLVGGANRSVFVKLKDDGAGVFKPKKGEVKRLRNGIDAGTYYKRERAAYLVDEFLGFSLVPPTVIRHIDGEEGSFQRFIADANVGYELARADFDRLTPWFKKMWIFDYIIANADRHEGNFLVKGDKVYAIDHGLAFAPSNNIRHYYEFYGAADWKEVSGKIGRFLSWEEGTKILNSLLLELLHRGQVDDVFKRIRLVDMLLQKHGTIPESARDKMIYG